MRPAPPLGSRNHDQKVGPQAANLILNRSSRPLSEAHRRDDGTHTDDDAENREGRAHLVATKGAKSGCQGHSEKLHGRVS